VVWAFDLADSNLPARLALPLLAANTLSTLVSSSPPPVVALGEPVLMSPHLSVEVPGGRRLFPDSQATDDESGVFSSTQRPGLYEIFNEDDGLVGVFAVHAGSALESNLTTRFQPDPLASVAASAVTAPPEEAFYEYWPWLAGLALTIVVVEGWLAWRR
jgi:hypothetical protein